MSFAFKDIAAVDQIAASTPDVTIVMPCLNEMQSLPHCMANALDALSRLRTELGLSGEILIADNGSTDGSQALATELGGRVVDVHERGYGAALIGGCRAAQGQFIIMGDCDGSYNFTEGVAMVAELQKGYDLCMGNRFRGGIAPGAMPWKNRYIGNPALTGILNIFFKTGMRDAHCGLRAISKNAFDRLNLSGSGMEFASEMVIKAALLKLKMKEVPATLSPDIRDRAPHLRPWRDGWRHLRYLFMLSPKWVFAVPSALAMTSAAVILATAILHAFGLVGDVPFGESWIVVGALLLSLGHMAGMMSVASYLHGVRAGYRLPKPWLASFSDALTLEGCVVSGLGLVAAAAVSMIGVAAYWGLDSFSALPSILPVALAGAAATIGFQTLFGGFLFAVIAGNDANFLRTAGDS
nr:glycosyltransferase family 2 protein [uncultured Sphingorhabdus sp.]